MKTLNSYPFYKSLRFRFGLIFGFVFLFFLLAAGLVLYTHVKGQFEKSFAARLQTQANLVLQETEINPLTVPLPTSGEFFRLIYQANNKQSILFDNLPLTFKNISYQADTRQWREKKISRALETGGTIQLWYVLPAQELNDEIHKVKIILFLYFPLSFLAAFIAGYFISGFLIRPIENIVTKANDISLQNQIVLLESPSVRDELHKLTHSLNQMLIRIQKQAQQQNAFFASASHELRTPLSVMLTELQILEKERLAPEMKTIIDNQVVEVQRLAKLVDDFLLMSQLKSDILALNLTSVKLPELVIGMLERLNPAAKSKNQSFKVELIPENGTFEIKTDRSHLVTILLNLLQNALIHGQYGSVIRIQLTETASSVTFVVVNTSHMKIDDPALLTREFHKQAIQEGGFGLGLWIVSRLAEKLDAECKLLYADPEFTATVSFKK